jgi:hypothetical protein
MLLLGRAIPGECSGSRPCIALPLDSAP